MDFILVFALVFAGLVLFALMTNWSLNLIEQALAELRREDLPPDGEKVV